MGAVTSADVAPFLPGVSRIAERLDGVGGAEYDDLFQEGSEKVFILLRDGLPVTGTAIRNAMRDWVRYCGRRGFAETMDESAMDHSGIHSAPGRKRVAWSDGDDAQQGGWSPIGYVPET